MTADAAERDHDVLRVLASAVDDALTRLCSGPLGHAGGGSRTDPGDADVIEERITETLLAYLAAIAPIQAELAVLRTDPATAPDGAFMRVMALLQSAFAHLGADDGIDAAITELRSARHLLTAITGSADDQVAG
ncbi:hypothetical protein LFM09_46145 [Lentzea alba]|uniref:hypothetical protein n=1 Tax=Lentzea alba TaxID=2714351 RepID=UPI0039BED6F1